MRLTRTGGRLPQQVAPGELLLQGLNVSAELGGRRIISDISIEVRAGEIVALVGPNGAGKSTLFSALSGDLRIAGGEVILDSQPLTAWSRVEMAMRRSVLPQQAVMTFPFLVDAVVRMGRAPWYGTSASEEDEEAVASALALTGLQQFAWRQFSSLSGGERARAAFARVLAQRAQLLLLDEPTAAMDIRHQELVFRLVKEQAAAGAGVLIVVHDLGMAAALADRVVLLRRGRVQAEGQPSAVFTSAILSEVYEHQVEVMPSPLDGAPLVLPVRAY